MSDYYPHLFRVVAGLDADTGESRRALYGRARAMLCEQLRRHEPPLTESEITRERLSLEAAIRKLEAEAIRRPHSPPVAHLISAANIEAVDARPLEIVSGAVMQAEPALTPTAAQPVAQRSARQLGRAALQRISVSQQAQQKATAQAVLTKLVETWQGARPANNSNPSARLRRRSLPDAPGQGDFITPLLWFLYIVLGFAQLIAFFHGLQVGFGLGGVASIGIFMLLYLTGSLGSIPMAIVSFYGAWRGWQWPIWGAALLAFPFVMLSFGFLGLGGFYSFFNRKKTPPIILVFSSLAESPWWRERARRWRAVSPRFGWHHPGAPGRRPRRPRRR